MIRERPGEKNDREYVISNIDNDRWNNNLDRYRENYDKINWKCHEITTSDVTKP